jgi:hypothetical protein
VWTDGTSSATEKMLSQPTPTGFTLLNAYDITSSADYTKDFNVTVSYSDAGMSPTEEASVRLYHYTGGLWEDITDSGQPDVGANTVSGTAGSFSDFAVFYTSESAPVVSTAASSGWSLALSVVLGGLLLTQRKRLTST